MDINTAIEASSAIERVGIVGILVLILGIMGWVMYRFFLSQLNGAKEDMTQMRATQAELREGQRNITQALGGEIREVRNALEKNLELQNKSIDIIAKYMEKETQLLRELTESKMGHSLEQLSKEIQEMRSDFERLRFEISGIYGAVSRKKVDSNVSELPFGVKEDSSSWEGM